MDENERMILYLLQSGDIDGRVANAMRKAKREYFLPQEFASRAYIDLPFPIGFGQTISAPSLVGYMTRMLRLEEGVKVLEVGSGSGWQAALIGAMVGEKGHVYTIERIPELAEMTRENITKVGLKNATVIEGDGSEGLDGEAPFDRIIVSAGAPDIPKPLTDQLKRGGRMIIPVGHMFWQDLMLVEKDEAGVVRSNAVLPVMFVPLVGRFAHPEQKKE